MKPPVSGAEHKAESYTRGSDRQVAKRRAGEGRKETAVLMPPAASTTVGFVTGAQSALPNLCKPHFTVAEEGPQ